MTTGIRIWRFVTILLVALLQGLAFAHVLERPAKMQYDAALYLTLQKTLYVAWGPPNIGAFLEPAAIVATIVLAFLLRRSPRAFWLTAGAACTLLLAFPVVFFWLVAPTNAAFASPASIPPNWVELRMNWEYGHALQFALQFAALSLITLSILIDEGRHRAYAKQLN
jgi:hypothetical protein